MITEKFKIERGRRGLCLFPTGEWDDSITRYMKGNGIRELFLNEAKGWKGRTIDFLEDLVELEGFSILDYGIESIAPVHSLKNLKALSIITLCRTRMDFAAFPRLEMCSMDWYPGCSSVFDCTWLTKLFLNCFKGKDSSAFAKLENLISLGIMNGPLPDIRGLSGLVNLKDLALCNLRNLSSLDGLQHLVNLTHLEIHGCRKIGRIDELSRLKNLIVLELNETGDIESLAPLKGLNALRHLYMFGGTKILDGDMSVIETLPALGDLAFMNRKFYSHRCEQFWQWTDKAFCPFNPYER